MAEEEDKKKAILLKNIKLDLNIDLESLRKEKTKTVVKLENKKNNKNNKKTTITLNFIYFHFYLLPPLFIYCHCCKNACFPFFARNSICLMVHPNEEPL